jgi:hypothetical protein
MVFNGHTSGPSYRTTFLPHDALIQLTEIAQSRLNIKLVRPQIPRHIGIDKKICNLMKKKLHPIKICRM